MEMNTLLPFTTFSSHQRLLLHSYRRLYHANLHITAAIRRHERHRQPRREPSPLDDRTEITVDFKQMRQRAAEVVEEAGRASEASVRRLVQRGKGAAAELWKDLRTSVTVASNKDQRLVIVVRRSSLQFLANALICSAFVVITYKLMRRWGWEWGADGQWIVRRDRSLGGRQVIVSRRGRGRAINSNFLSSPLASAVESRSEREMMKNKKEQQRERKKASPLPSWWPPPDIPVEVSSENYKSGQFYAKTLLKVIMDNRMKGRDFSKEEILQLRQICKASGVTVSFQMANVRDSFYRAAIDFVLTTCSSSSSGFSSPRFGGEEATQFIAGLALNIGLKADRATTMVNAAVAAQMRSSFLQAWALIIQGKIIEAQDIFLKISRIHLIFPSETNSAEIDMVAQGLKSHLKLEERKQLLNMFTEVCGASNQRIAVEALGLVSRWEGTNKDFLT